MIYFVKKEFKVPKYTRRSPFTLQVAIKSCPVRNITATDTGWSIAVGSSGEKWTFCISK
jgi:hypothetical protein